MGLSGERPSLRFASTFERQGLKYSKSMGFPIFVICFGETPALSIHVFVKSETVKKLS
jgi:hypothetical protein